MNIAHEPDPQSLSSYRKASIASWNHPRDPTTYSFLDFAVEEAESFLAEQAADGVKPTLTQYVVQVFGHCMDRHPQFNQVLRKGRLYPRKQTDAFVTTLIKGKRGNDLSGFALADVPSRSLIELTQESNAAVVKLRKGEDREMARLKKMLERTPGWLLRLVYPIQEFLAFTLNWNLSWAGVPKDRYGSFMVSNIGALGLERGLIPLSPYTRCPMILGVGKPREAPVVRDGKIVVGRVVTVSFSFDHRYGDGADGASIIRRFTKVFERPRDFPQVFEGGS